MLAIAPTINPGDSGPQVANLYEVLQFLIDKDAFASIDPSELDRLKDQLRSEEPSGFSKGAAVTLVQQFQVQEALGDGLAGVVEESIADILSRLLKKFGAFDTGTDFVVRGTVKDARKRPQAGLVVIAFDRDLRRWQEHGRTETDPEGKFEIPYRYESFCQAEGLVQPEVDLVLKVARRQAYDEVEPIHVHEEPKPVPPVVSINAVLSAAMDADPSEFDRCATQTFHCRPAAPQLHPMATRCGRFCFLLQNSLC